MKKLYSDSITVIWTGLPGDIIDWFPNGKLITEIVIYYKAIAFRVRLRKYAKNKKYDYVGTVAVLDPTTGQVLISEVRKRKYIKELCSYYGFLPEDAIDQYISTSKAEAEATFNSMHSILENDYESLLGETINTAEINARTKNRRRMEAWSEVYIACGKSITESVTNCIKKLYKENIDQLRIYLAESNSKNTIKPDAVIFTHLDHFLEERYGSSNSSKAKRYGRQIINLFNLLDNSKSMLMQEPIKYKKQKNLSPAVVSSGRIFWKWGVDNKFWEGVYPVDKIPSNANSDQKHHRGKKAALLQAVLNNDEKRALRDYIADHVNIDTAITVLVASNFKDNEIINLMLSDTKIYDIEKVIVKVVREDFGPVQTYLRYTVPYLTPSLYKYIRSIRSKIQEKTDMPSDSISLFLIDKKKIDVPYITKAVRETMRFAGVEPRKNGDSVIEYKVLLRNTFRNDIEFNCGISDDQGFIKILKGEIPDSVTDRHYVGYNSPEALTHAYRILRDMSPPTPTNAKVEINESSVLYYPEKTNEYVHISGRATITPGDKIEFYTEAGASYSIYRKN